MGAARAIQRHAAWPAAQPLARSDAGGSGGRRVAGDGASRGAGILRWVGCARAPDRGDDRHQTRAAHEGMHGQNIAPRRGGRPRKGARGRDPSTPCRRCDESLAATATRDYLSGNVTAPEESIRATLIKLFDAEREARRQHDELAALAAKRSQRDVLVAALRETIGEVMADEAAGAEDATDAVVKLVCVARLLGEFEGPEVADALVDVLDSVQPEARSEAGEQLQGLAYDRFKEVALAVERALASRDGGHALVELPYLLADIPEGGVVRLLKQFLEHRDGDAVAAAIEALVEVGDPAAIGALEALTGDKRISRIGDEDASEAGDVTVGELAAEAIELLQQMSEDLDDDRDDE